MSYTIFGRDFSLFTRKLEAAFDFYGLAYASIDKDIASGDSLEARAGSHQIPLLETPEGWLLADSTPIIQLLDARRPWRRLFPVGLNGVLVHVLEEVLDEWVARVMVHYRWHYDANAVHLISHLTGEAVDAAAAQAHPLTAWGLRACRATGTEAVSQQAAAEREYLDIVSALERQLSQTPFALGARPTAVDAALLGGFRGHTLMDPVPDLGEYRRVLGWVSSPGQGADGARLPEFPDTTPFGEHLLELAAQPYRNFVLGNAAALAAGDKAFVCETYGEPVSYLCRVYPERSRRLVRDRIAFQLTADEQRQARMWLEHHGLAECFLP